MNVEFDMTHEYLSSRQFRETSAVIFRNAILGSFSVEFVKIFFSFLACFERDFVADSSKCGRFKK